DKDTGVLHVRGQWLPRVGRFLGCQQPVWLGNVVATCPAARWPRASTRNSAIWLNHAESVGLTRAQQGGEAICHAGGRGVESRRAVSKVPAKRPLWLSPEAGIETTKSIVCCRRKKTG